MFFGLFAKANHSLQVEKKANIFFSKPSNKSPIEVPTSLRAANDLCDQITRKNAIPNVPAIIALLTSDYLKNVFPAKLFNLLKLLTESPDLQNLNQFTTSNVSEAKKIKENLITVINKLDEVDETALQEARLKDDQPEAKKLKAKQLDYKNLSINASFLALASENSFLGNIFHIQRNWFGKPSPMNKNSSLYNVLINLHRKLECSPSVNLSERTKQAISNLGTDVKEFIKSHRKYVNHVLNQNAAPASVSNRRPR